MRLKCNLMLVNTNKGHFLYKSESLHVGVSLQCRFTFLCDTNTLHGVKAECVSGLKT